MYWLKSHTDGQLLLPHLRFNVATVFLKDCHELINLSLGPLPIFCGECIRSHHMYARILGPLQEIYKCTASIPVASKRLAVLNYSITAIAVHNYGNMPGHHCGYGSAFVVITRRVVRLPSVEYMAQNYRE